MPLQLQHSEIRLYKHVYLFYIHFAYVSLTDPFTNEPGYVEVDGPMLLQFKLVVDFGEAYEAFDYYKETVTSIKKSLKIPKG